MIDTATTVEIKRSPRKLQSLILGGVGFFAVGIWLISGGAAESESAFSVYLGWACCLFFGSITIMQIIAYARIEMLSVIISPNGIYDSRFFSQEIPWSMINRFSKRKVYGVNILHLNIAPDQYSNLNPTFHGKIVNWLNKPFGFGASLDLNVADLDIDFDKLVETVAAYLKAHNPVSIDEN